MTYEIIQQAAVAVAIVLLAISCSYQDWRRSRLFEDLVNIVKKNDHTAEAVKQEGWELPSDMTLVDCTTYKASVDHDAIAEDILNTLLPMSFYDRQRVLVDVNKKICLRCYQDITSHRCYCDDNTSIKIQSGEYYGQRY